MNEVAVIRYENALNQKNQPSKLAHDDMPPLDQEVQLGYPVHIIDRIIQISYLSTSEPLPYCPSVQTPETGEVRGRALPALLERLRLSGEQNSTQKLKTFKRNDTK